MRRARASAGLALAVVAAGAVLRFWYCARVYGSFSNEESYYTDSVAWLSSGQLRAWRGPLYGSFIAACEAPFATPAPGHVRAGLAAASALGVAGTLSLAPVFTVVPAAALAFSATHVAALDSLNIHAFYGLLLLALALAACAWARRPSWWATAALGAACGASLLCRSAHMPLPLLLAGYAVWRERGRARGWLRAALLLSCTAAAAAPWALRNFASEGRFYPLDLDAGAVNLYAGSRGEVDGISVMQALEQADRESPGIVELSSRDASLAYARLRALAWRHVRRHPFRFARAVLAREVLLFWPTAWLLLLGVYGLWRRRREPEAQALALCAASLSFYAAVAIAVDYRDGVLPLALVLGGMGAACVWEDLGRAPAPRPAAPTRALLAAAWAPFAAAYAVMLALFILPVLAPQSQPDARQRLVEDLRVRSTGGRWGWTATASRDFASRPDEACRVALARPLDPGGDTSGAKVKAACLAWRVRRGADADAAAAEYAPLVTMVSGGPRTEPGLAEKSLARAELLAAAGRAADAALDARRAFKAASTPDLAARAAAVLARAAAARGDAQSALAEARTSLSLDPNSQGPRRLVVAALAARGRLQEAEAEASALPAEGSDRPDDVPVGLPMAAAPLELPEDAAARRWLAKALAARLESPAWRALPPGASLPPLLRAQGEPELLARAALLLHVGELRLSMACAARALSSPSVQPSTRAALLVMTAVAQLRFGHRMEADRTLRLAVEVDPARACRADFDGYDRGAVDPAFFDACVAALPTDARQRVDRGVSLFRAGRKAEAIADFREALRLSPGSRAARQSLQAALER